jgi:YidC/Oxa1 family membrane protein insertase
MRADGIRYRKKYLKGKVVDKNKLKGMLLREKRQALEDSLARVEKERIENGELTEDFTADTNKHGQQQIAAGTARPADTVEGTPESAAGADVPDVQLPLKEIMVETNKFAVTLSTMGGCITEVVLKDLKSKNDTAYPSLLNPDRGGALTLELGNRDLSQIIWATADTSASSINVSSQPYEITFSTELRPGLEVARTYTFYPDSNLIKHDFSHEKLNTSYALNWTSGMREPEKMPEGRGWGLTFSFFSEVILNDGAEVMRKIVKKKTTYNENSGIIKWVGLRRKYVAMLMNFNKSLTSQVIARPILEGEEKNGRTHTYELTVKSQNLEDNALDFDFVILPLRYNKILSYDKGYEKIIFTGWSWMGADVWYVWLCGFILNLLNKFFSLVPNYGIAIILLTLLVRTVLMPLTIPQTRSMSKMQEHTPAVNEIKAKFKGNPGRANKEVMDYYRSVGVNPMAPMVGCLPVLLQFPVFIGLYNVFSRAVELKEAPFFAWVSDLSRPDVLIESIKIPYLFPAGLTILPLIMAVTFYFQMKITITDPRQKMMVYMMPGMMLFISASFPSGLVLYWTVSNFCSIGQTVLLKKFKSAPKVAPPKKEAPRISGKKKGKKRR